MKITIVTLGTRGDVQPCIAMGLGLRAAGHEVKIAAPAEYGHLARNKGLDYFPLQNAFRHIFETESECSRLKEEINPLRLIFRQRSVVEPVVNQIFSDLWTACQDTDLILYTILALPAYYYAQDLGIPAFMVCLQPLCRTRAFPSVLFSPKISNIAWVNRASYILVEQAMWRFLRPYFVCWRKKMGLSAVSFWGHFNQFDGHKTPIFNGYSSSVVPKPKDWGDRNYVTGYWFLDSTPPNWQPPPDLVRFLKQGSRPVCFGFGSMNDSRVANMVKMAIGALEKSGQRGILLTGKSDLKKDELPLSDHVFVAEEIPHAWLFQHAAAVIHHGGAGTTATAIRAGIPSIIIPFFFDQLFWGRQLATLGVGPEPVIKRRLSVDGLALSLKDALDNKTYQNRLQALSKQINDENGVGCVVDTFHRELARL
jgi:sterol 3beta-glucosyltransferase